VGVADSVRERTDGDPAGPGDAPAAAVRGRPGRQRIVDTARRLFATRGYERTPLRLVADSLGVTKAAVYHHFRAKDELLVAVVGPLLDRLDEVTASAGGPLAPAARWDLLGRYVDELGAHAESAVLLLTDSAVGAHAVGRRFATQRTRLREALGAPDGLVAGIRTATAMRTLELAVVEFGDADPAEMRETALRIAADILGAGDPPRA
jgi:AcrR family transcriptional regulator